ncbi:MAG TPA: SDR family NAD(P)-dependent oxidoreductase, partial [Anaerolineae bacterium]|nr:SDR family NAD(P)-dependent oxidoreductase [Anaerolineae bacterium]
MDAQPTISGTGDLTHTSLAGQVAVVTGAGQGIGRAIAVTFANLGASVVVAEISAAGQETERAIHQIGGQALFVQTDVSSQASVEELARRVQEAFGPVDILINNAIISPVASVAEMDVALWDRVMAVNLRGTFLTCKAFLPGMLERKRGV